MMVAPARLAEKLGVSANTLANWRQKGFGPAFIKIGGRVAYEEADVQAWIASRRRTSTTPEAAQ